MSDNLPNISGAEHGQDSGQNHNLVQVISSILLEIQNESLRSRALGILLRWTEWCQELDLAIAEYRENCASFAETVAQVAVSQDGDRAAEIVSQHVRARNMLMEHISLREQLSALRLRLLEAINRHRSETRGRQLPPCIEEHRYAGPPLLTFQEVECPICAAGPELEGLRREEGEGEDMDYGGIVRLYGCNHAFHQWCISTWINGMAHNALRFPLCRAEMVILPA